MRISIRRKALLAGVCITAGLLADVAAWGQGSVKEKDKPPFDVAITYNTLRGNSTTGQSFWMQGGRVQVHDQFWHEIGMVADVAGEHVGNIGTTGVGLDLVTVTFGPRYTWTKDHARYALFGQALVGEAFGLHSTFPGASQASEDANNLAVRVGGGVDYTLTRRFALRAIEADWLRTQLTNATTNAQNNVSLGAGLVIHLHGR